MAEEKSTSLAAGLATSSTSPAAKPAAPASSTKALAEESGEGNNRSEPLPAMASALSPHNEIVEADDDTFSDLGSDQSDTTSIASSLFAGYLENGRRYQTLREGEYWGPSDEKQFESQLGAHVLNLVVDSQEPNPFFRAPVPDTVQHILDIGTGNGAWARDVADRYPAAHIQGVDLFPPPDSWVPPNCTFTVDDVLKPWLFGQVFDFIHLRYMYGAFTPAQWTGVYKQAYENLAPGGWIEQQEPDITFRCDDGTMPADSLMAGWGPMFNGCCERAGKPLDICHTMKASIEAAGFVNTQVSYMKVPFGAWAKNKLMREAGAINKEQLMEGLEGYVAFSLTRFGLPEPWTPEEVQVYLAQVRKEMNSGWHAYLVWTRVWAQKPMNEDPVAVKAKGDNEIVV